MNLLLKKKIHPKLGLTLVELQIAIAIMAGLSFLFASIYYGQTRLFGEEKTTIKVASENRIALDEITNQIRESPGIILGCTICGTSTNSTSAILIISLWPIDSSGDLTEPTSGEFDYMVYRINGQNLLKEIFPNGTTSYRINTSKILASNVKTILFEYDTPLDIADASAVTVTLTTEAKSFTKTHTLSQESKAILRNK